MSRKAMKLSQISFWEETYEKMKNSSCKINSVASFQHHAESSLLSKSGSNVSRATPALPSSFPLQELSVT